MSDADAGRGSGAQFIAAREALGLAEEDVADALNLSARVITHLESEAWDSLPAPAFTRGYIRAYAKLLELDADALVESYQREFVGEEIVALDLPDPTPNATNIGELASQQPGRVISGAVVAVVALVLVVLWMVWPEGDQRPAQVALAPTPAEPTQQIDSRSAGRPPMAEQSVPGIRSDPAPADVVAEPTPDLAKNPVQDPADGAGEELAGRSETQPVPTTELEPAVEPAQPSETAVGPTTEPDPEPPPAAEAPPVPASGPAIAGGGRDITRRISASGDDQLTLEFTADCWVEVKDRNERNVYSNLGRAGETLELVGEAPLRLLLGYAPGVVLKFNGEPVPLSGYTRNNVAALWLGRG